jgi:hypothetical protein
MLLLKRLGTSFIVFLILFVLLFIGSLAICGAVVGARAGQGDQGEKNFQAGFEAGQRAGAEFAHKYRGIIFVGAVGIAGATSLSLSFSGIFPWCRSSPKPPKFP